MIRAQTVKKQLAACAVLLVLIAQPAFSRSPREDEDYFREQIQEHPKLAANYNRLGILLVQRGGRQAEAIRCFHMAITLDPDNGDSCLNLAVVFATFQPPKKDLAQRFYREAMLRGVERDKNLERLIDWNISRHAPNHAMQLTVPRRHSLCYRPADLPAQPAPSLHRS